MKNEVKNLTEGQVLANLFNHHPELKPRQAAILGAFESLCDCWAKNGKILICGNGGSAADSEHMVGELVKSFMFKRSISAHFYAKYEKMYGSVPGWLEGSLPAISLVSQSAFFTAFANDADAVGVFAQQVYCYGQPGDVLFAFSTSGNSKNVVEAARVAKAMDMKVVALTGADKSALASLSDVCIQVPEDETYRVQELHLPIYHALCAAAEARFF